MSNNTVVKEPEALTMSVPEFAAIMGISERHAYESIARGEIEGVVEIGRRKLIPRWIVTKMLGLERS